MENKVILTATGDVFPANLSYHRGKGIISNFNKHNGVPWQESFLKIFANSDIGLINLEAPILPNSEFKDSMTFAGNDNIISFLKNCGINVINIANNHILEYGPEGFNNTINILQNNGLNIIGRYQNTIYDYYKNNMKISIAAFNDIHDIYNTKLYQDYNREAILNCINKMGNADCKILVFHWGNEYINIPSYKQIENAKEFIDAGADIIIGHHPHVIQPVMEYKQGIICYSLGNFIFDMIYKNNVRIGMVIQFVIIKGKKPKYEIKGIYIKDDYTPSLIDTNIFNNIYKKYEKIFYNFLELSENDYEKKYNLLLKKNRLIQRIIMKKDLINNINNISMKDVNNIINSKLNKFNKIKYI